MSSIATFATSCPLLFSLACTSRQSVSVLLSYLRNGDCFTHLIQWLASLTVFVGRFRPVTRRSFFPASPSASQLCFCYSFPGSGTFAKWNALLQTSSNCSLFDSSNFKLLISFQEKVLKNQHIHFGS